MCSNNTVVDKFINGIYKKEHVGILNFIPSENVKIIYLFVVALLLSLNFFVQGLPLVGFVGHLFSAIQRTNLTLVGA